MTLKAPLGNLGLGVEGKRVLVTAGAGGIGLAIASQLLALGARVFVCDVAEAPLAAFRTGHPGVGHSLTDVADEAAVDRMFAEIASTLGGLDALINNAGIAGPTGGVDEIAPADWRRTIEVNLIGSYHCIRAAVPPMKARGAGKIIVVGSGQGHNGTAATSAYASSKAGTWALTRSVAAELIGFNISVNELLPGNVRTQLYDETFAQTVAMTPDGGEPISAKRSHEWLKEPDDVVPLALFMACQPDVGPTAQSFSLMRRL